MNRLLAAGIMAMAMLIPATVGNAQSSENAEDLYGQGVHAYHAGQYQQAMTALSQAIELGSRDPRVYYFRGLTQSAMGDLQTAQGDFLMGARLEATPAGRHYAVGRALERVQGGMRMQIEEARRNAKFIAEADATNAPRQPGGTGGDDPPLIPDPSPAGQPAAQTNFPDVTGIENPGTPFDAPIEPREIKPTQRVPAPEPEVEDSATPEKQPAQPMRDDPFGEAGGDAPAAAPEKSDDPSGDKGAEKSDDPFGEGGGETEKSDDPFGDDGEEMEKPADDKSEDPFGDDGDEGEKQGEQAGDEDPFGDEDAKEDAGDEKKDSGDDKKKSPPDDPFGDDG